MIETLCKLILVAISGSLGYWIGRMRGIDQAARETLKPKDKQARWWRSAVIDAECVKEFSK